MKDLLGSDGEQGRLMETRGSVPVPDPTTLTREALNREITSLKEILATRFEGYDKAIQLLQNKADRSPSIDVVDLRVEKLEAVVFEKFSNVATQFSERDIRAEQTARDSKVAVDAALQAAKEAVGEQNKSSALAIAKSEAATTKQIDQIQIQIQTTTRGVDDKIDDIKSRLTSLEGKKVGSDDQRQTTQQSWGWAVGVLGLILSFMTAVIGAVVYVTRASPTP